MDFETFQNVLQLGWPAIVLLMVWFLWVEYKRVMTAYIADLREMAGLRASLAPAASSSKNRPAVPGGPVNGGNGGGT